MWYRPTSPYVISTESQGWLIVRHASLTCNNWYQPEPHSQFNVPPYVFIYCHEIPLHVNGIAAADEFASFPFQTRRDGPGDPIWVWWWYILYHDTSYTPFALKMLSHNWDNSPDTIINKTPPILFIYHNKPQIRPRRPRLARAWCKKRTSHPPHINSYVPHFAHPIVYITNYLLPRQ